MRLSGVTDAARVARAADQVHANARLTRITPTAVLDCKRRSAVIPWVDLTEAASTV